jgi:LysM repeat protein
MKRLNRPSTAPSVPPRLCPMCGTRASAGASKCLVCGTNLNRTPERLAQRRRLKYPNPIAVALLGILVAAGSWMLLVANGTLPMPAMLVPDTPTITPTFTNVPTGTPTRTATATREPTATPLPPIPYRVKDGDSCLLIAIIHDISVESLIFQNNLDPNCTIYVGRELLVPQPTAVATSPMAATLRPGQPTPMAQPTYVVLAGDTCIGIAFKLGVGMEELMALNGLGNCNLLREGQVLLLPFKPGAQATDTPSPP